MNDLCILEGYLLEISAKILKRIKTIKGWHYITEPFDTREVCKLDYVTLLRDGYVFVKEIK
jgi:hypothetical protein